MSDPEPAERTPGGAVRLAGLGMELAGAIVGFSLLGYWIDRHWQNERPWALVVCASLGIVGGLYNLIRKSVHASLGLTKPRSGSGARLNGKRQQDRTD